LASIVRPVHFLQYFRACFVRLCAVLWYCPAYDVPTTISEGPVSVAGISKWLESYECGGRGGCTKGRAAMPRGTPFQKDVSLPTRGKSWPTTVQMKKGAGASPLSLELTPLNRNPSRGWVPATPGSQSCNVAWKESKPGASNSSFPVNASRYLKVRELGVVEGLYAGWFGA
jgi:hypothetical protein